jgi:hypothetical protein
MLGTQHEFIAQEVEKILPSVALTEDNAEKTKDLKPTELIPVLTKAIQQLRVEFKAAKDNDATAIEELHKEIGALKAGTR